MGLTKRWKYLSDVKWKQKPNGWVLENWGILSDEWRKLSEKLWVIKKKIQTEPYLLMWYFRLIFFWDNVDERGKK